MQRCEMLSFIREEFLAFCALLADWHLHSRAARSTAFSILTPFGRDHTNLAAVVAALRRR